MRIGIDITFLKDQYAHRGIGTYGKQLIKRLILNPEHEWILFGFDDLESNLLALETKSNPQIKFISLGRPRKSNLSNFLFFALVFKPKILAAKLDLFYAPHLERGLPLKYVKTALMVHDVIPLMTGKFSNHGGLLNYFKGIFYKNNLNHAKKADLILTNSDFSKRELINKGGFEPDKITRTYLGIKPEFREENITSDTRDTRRVLMMYKIPKPYILYYGGLEANKNVSNLFYAFRNVTKRFPDMKLVIVGKDFKLGWDNKVQPLTKPAEALIALAGELKIKHNVIYTGDVEDQHVPLIMKNASIFVHLSSYEGFGFSPLEAMAAGVPCVAARRSCYPEVLQDGAELVNPKDIDKVSDAILSLLEDEEKRNRISQKGLQVAKAYNWEKTTADTLKAFNELGQIKPKLNLAYVVPTFYPYSGGAENNCLNLALAQVALGNSVKVLTSDDHCSTRHEFYKSIEIFRFHKLNKAYYFGFYPEIIQKIVSVNADIIHVHGFGFIWHDLGLILRKILRPRTIIINTPHGPFMSQKSYSFGKRLAKGIFTAIQKLYLNKIYTTVIAVNPTQEKWITSYGISKKKIQYVPNGIPEEYLKTVDTKVAADELKLNKKFVISFIGRYEKYKGLQDLISAMPAVLEVQKSVKLVAMGNPGSYLPALRKQVIDLGLENEVDILENPSDETLEQVLTLSKIFVLPSDWEAFGISMLQAMAKGNAVISSRTEGGEFLVKEEENGYIFDFGDSKQIADYIIKLLNDRKLLATIGDKNVVKAKQFTWNNISKSYSNILYELLKQ